MTEEPEEEKSFGNISERHWTRARRGLHQEALDYLRSRSKAPGVREGGSARNHYCMQCDGVIPHGVLSERCPHCQAPLTGQSKRYFNWVEIDQPPKSDLRALLPWLALAAVLAVGLLWLVIRGFSGG